MSRYLAAAALLHRLGHHRGFARPLRTSDVPDARELAGEVIEFILAQIDEAVRSGSSAGIFDVSLEFTKEEDVEAFQASPTEQTLEWLRANGHADLASELTYKAVARSLASDLVEFVGVALKCVYFGALTPALALLRKPFKENLHYLEWMLADPATFLADFTSGNLDALSISDSGEKRRIEFIRGAMAQTSYGEWLDAAFLHELRFDKKSRVGLEPVWQKANHLITRKGQLRTEVENFNFIFSADDARDTQIRGFFAITPLLSFHSLQIIEGVIAQFASRAAPDLIPLRTAAGMLLWLSSEASYLELDDARQSPALTYWREGAQRAPSLLTSSSGGYYLRLEPSSLSLSGAAHCCSCQAWGFCCSGLFSWCFGEFIVRRPYARFSTK